MHGLLLVWFRTYTRHSESLPLALGEWRPLLVFFSGRPSLWHLNFVIGRPARRRVQERSFSSSFRAKIQGISSHFIRNTPQWDVRPRDLGRALKGRTYAAIQRESYESIPPSLLLDKQALAKRMRYGWASPKPKVMC